MLTFTRTMITQLWCRVHIVVAIGTLQILHKIKRMLPSHVNFGGQIVRETGSRGIWGIWPWSIHNKLHKAYVCTCSTGDGNTVNLKLHSITPKTAYRVRSFLQWQLSFATIGYAASPCMHDWFCQVSIFYSKENALVPQHTLHLVRIFFFICYMHNLVCSFISRYVLKETVKRIINHLQYGIYGNSQ